MARSRAKPPDKPDATGVGSQGDPPNTAAFILKFLNRTWFDGRFDREAEPYMVRLLIGIYLCYTEGYLLTKKQARECIRAVDGRTSQRYLGLAEKQGLLTIVQSSIDRRVDLLRPDDSLLDLVENELSILSNELLIARNTLSGDSPSQRGWRTSMVIDQFFPLISDQHPPIESYEKDQIERFTETIRIVPKNAAARHKRGYVYLCGTLEYDKAIEDFSEAIRLQPNNPHSYYWRGHIFSFPGANKLNYDRAIADFSEAIRLDPTEDLYYRMRADAYSKKGERKKARADRDAAKSLKRDDTDTD